MSARVTLRTASLRAACVTVVGALTASAGCASDPAPPVVEGEGGAWELRAPLAAGARQETAVVALDGEVVVIGGFNALGGEVALVEAYDPGADVWRRMPDVPTPMHHANAAVVDGRIVIAGFLTSASFTPDGRVFIFDPATNAWSDGARMPAGTERGACGVAVDPLDDDGVLLFGGTQGGSSRLVSRYDLGDDAWTELTELPTALDHLGAATVDGRVFVVGGRTNGLRNHTAATLELVRAGGDDEGAFVARAPMPTPRAGFGLAAVTRPDDGTGGGGATEIFVAGGEGNSARDDGVFPQTEAYDPGTDTWRAVLEMRTPRHGMGATSIQGALYVPGGADRQQFAAVDVVERFVPAP